MAVFVNFTSYAAENGSSKAENGMFNRRTEDLLRRTGEVIIPDLPHDQVGSRAGVSGCVNVYRTQGPETYNHRHYGSV